VNEPKWVRHLGFFFEELAMTKAQAINDTIYRTTDLNLAAFLSLQGFRLKSLNHNDRGEGVFAFDASLANIQEAVLDFHSGALVAAQQFGNKLRDMKFLVKRGGLRP